MNAINNYNINEFIPALRLRNAIKQKELVTDEEGVADTIYKLEKGKIKSRSTTIQNFLEDLGYIYDVKSNIYLANIDIEGDMATECLLYYIKMCDISNAREKLNFLEKRKFFKIGTRLQFFLSSKAQILLLEKKPLEEIFDLVKQAMIITYEKFVLENIENHLFLPEEIVLIHTTAKAYRLHGNIKKAISILYILEKSINQLPIETHGKNFSYIDVVLTLTTYLLEINEFQEAYDFCEEAFNHSNHHCKGYKVCELKHLLAILAYKLGNTAKSIGFFTHAYVGYIMSGFKENAENLIKEAKERYSLDIKTYGLDDIEIERPLFMPFERGSVPNYTHIGELIYLLRTERNINQRNLAQGICDRASLSKIENKNIETEIYKIEALFQRLGRYPYYYTSNYLSKEEFKEYRIKYDIVDLLSIREYQVVIGLIEKLEKSKYFQSNLGKQFILSSKSAIKDESDKEDNAKKLESLYEAINMTIPNFDENDVHKYNLTFDEILILNRIAIRHSSMMNQLKAVSLLEKLLQNLDENYVDERERMRLYNFILANYCNELVGLGMFDKALENAGKGWKLELKWDFFKVLPSFAATKAIVYLKQGEKEKSIPYFTMVYFSSLLTNRLDNAELIQKFILENDININIDQSHGFITI